MKLGLRIFLCYLAIFAFGVYVPINWMWNTLRTRYLEAVEEPLVDTANIVAALIEEDVARPNFDPEPLRARLARAQTRVPEARIYDLLKTEVDLQLYLTDANGRVLLDTRAPAALGADYSRKRDVKLTLEGRYGARTSLLADNDIFSSALHVAAPLYDGNRIAGVLTMVEPTATIETFLHLARPAVVQAGLLSLFVAALISLAVSYGLTRPIHRLARYADDIRDGRRPAFPQLGRTEVADLGLSLRRMQEALEGRRYAEEYVQTLTHELKSPLSAIRGAAELLQENVPPAQQARFVANIRTETERIGRIVERMLELATLENRREQPEMAAVDVDALVHTIAEASEPQLNAKNVRLELSLPEKLVISGNGFLLHQALANLVQNAIDFSPAGGAVAVSARLDKDTVVLAVSDQGPGVPDYAQARIFERFYSLARPDTGKKSTGLGLNLVREAAQAHGGSVSLSNRPEGGALAELVIPI
jgi:two-component system, OmpR family, sensor histidine kinase CreC